MTWQPLRSTLLLDLVLKMHGFMGLQATAKYKPMNDDGDFQRDTWVESLPFGTVEDAVLRNVTVLIVRSCVET